MSVERRIYDGIIEHLGDKDTEEINAFDLCKTLTFALTRCGIACETYIGQNENIIEISMPDLNIYSKEIPVGQSRTELTHTIADIIRDNERDELYNQSNRLFVDMDGTLGRFTPVDEIEELYEKGYFFNIQPHGNVIEGIKILMQERPELEVYVLSAVLKDSPFAEQEKNEWLDKYLPEIDQSHRIYTPCGVNKAEYLMNNCKEQLINPIGLNDYLLDDYSKNLFDWSKKGTAIKLMNDINGTKGSWNGCKMDYDLSPDSFRFMLESKMNYEHQLYHLPTYIKIVSQEEMLKIVSDYQEETHNYGQFICYEPSGCNEYTICDNSDGNAWTEGTSNLDAAVLWMQEKIGLEELYNNFNPVVYISEKNQSKYVSMLDEDDFSKLHNAITERLERDGCTKEQIRDITDNAMAGRISDINGTGIEVKWNGKVNIHLKSMPELGKTDEGRKLSQAEELTKSSQSKEKE